MQEQACALVLDGNHRNALAATRALGKQGFRVIVGDPKRLCLAGVSRYCEATLQYPAPDEEPEGFIRTVAGALETESVDFVLPMTDSTLSLVMKAKEQFGSRIPFGPETAFDILSHKGKVLKLAREVGVAVPKSRLMEPGVDCSRVAGAVEQLGGYPVVLKPCRSSVWAESRYLAGKVEVIKDRQGLETALENGPAFRHGSFLVQEVIEGYGAGLFVLFDGNAGLAWFSHRRLRERPPEGGVSTLSESAPFSYLLQQSAERILQKVGWHGPAMFEFRVAPDGIPYLMEINPRFWGSLQLALDAGINFPLLSFNLGKRDRERIRFPAVNEYKVGIRSRWFLGDLHRLLMVFGSRADRGAKFRALLAFVSTAGDLKARNAVFRFEDIRPGLFEFLQFLPGAHWILPESRILKHSEPQMFNKSKAPPWRGG
ncbi:carboxylate--amine ligase [Thiohalomonas denitrificans]|uniref:carboxylate--amine ligase n=1 Tax=Thiohalomonas denitrificans TaxID=415747 RepID=UPI0026EC9065|nr:ATP-grasp domain-containing protein [Thiohalomonas denitrificans]